MATAASQEFSLMMLRALHRCLLFRVFTPRWQLPSQAPNLVSGLGFGNQVRISEVTTICQILNVLSNEQRPVEIFEPLHLAHEIALRLLSLKTKANEKTIPQKKIALGDVGFPTRSSEDKRFTIICVKDILCPCLNGPLQDLKDSRVTEQALHMLQDAMLGDPEAVKTIDLLLMSRKWLTEAADLYVNMVGLGGRGFGAQ